MFLFFRHCENTALAKAINHKYEVTTSTKQSQFVCITLQTVSVYIIHHWVITEMLIAAQLIKKFYTPNRQWWFINYVHMNLYDSTYLLKTKSIQSSVTSILSTSVFTLHVSILKDHLQRCINITKRTVTVTVYAIYAHIWLPIWECTRWLDFQVEDKIEEGTLNFHLSAHVGTHQSNLFKTLY
jgi:hypothetical protein